MNLRALRLPAVLLAASLLPVAGYAQRVAGAPPLSPLKDTSPLKLAPGQRAMIVEFEDLECPACAHAAPIVKQALDTYKIPFQRHDFLIQNHYWSRDAAIIARYLEDKVNPGLAEQYRRDVFANQTAIATKDDLQGYTRKWFQNHGQQMPFVMDPSGRFMAEIQSDITLGERIGLSSTPLIIVVSPHGYTQVTDISQLYTTIDSALAEAPIKAAAPAKSAARKSTATKK